MKRLSTVLLLLAVILAGCKTATKSTEQKPEEITYRYTKTPQEAVDAWIAAANQGTYGEAARYYHEAIEVWHSDPAMWKFVVEQATKGQQIVSHTPTPKSVEKADSATLVYEVHYSDGSRWWRRFELVKKKDGWIIIQIS